MQFAFIRVLGQSRRIEEYGGGVAELPLCWVARNGAGR